ncbi:MAG: FecR domain-containing protein [Rudaea sp.]
MAIVFIIAGTVFGAAMGKAQAAEDCAPVLARIASVQGSVEVRRSQRADWQSADPASVLCAGDRIRVKERSRAALLMTNESTLRLDQNTTLILAAPEDEKTSLMELLSGVLQVITRTPRPFKVKTPYVNAGVEGTEFLVGVDAGSARVAVYEGRVSAANDLGILTLIAGEIALTASNQAPRKERMVRPVDAVQWALYYPNVIDYGLDGKLRGSAAEAALRESLALYRQGRLAEAIDRTDKAPEGRGDPRFLTYRAGLLLLVGRVDEAMPEIEKALAADARNSDAHALQAIIAVVQNDKDQALKLATRAVELDPASPAARKAMSYAQQAYFRLEDAQASVRKAVELNPNSALAWARLAELQMSTGDLDGALASARHAVEIEPRLAKTQSVLGFAHLARFDTGAAKQAFEQAIALDQAEPFARLGLGLAKIREGDLTGGREKIEIAVSLDPGNALIRSYMGKAYYEEKRDKLAGTQFDLAKAYDPRDPTPWFYDAIRKQTDNRPVEALQDLQKSIELNDNRAIYRSKLLLDQDVAARESNLAAIYEDVGVTQIAILEGAKAVTADPSEFSSHRLLAESYATLPRHEIARASEALQAQLREPPSLAPLPQPFLTGDNFSFARTPGLSTPGYNEYARLFDQDGFAGIADALAGGVKGDRIVATALRENMAIGLEQQYESFGGFRSNGDLSRRLYSGLITVQPSPSSSFQAQVTHLEKENGDLQIRFDPEFIRPDREDTQNTTFRLGARHVLSPGQEILASFVSERLPTRLTTGGAIVDQTDTAKTAEFQYVLKVRGATVVAGAGGLRGDSEFSLSVPESPLLNTSTDSQRSHRNGYIYATWDLIPNRLRAQLGVSVDRVKEPDVRRNQISPKLGLVIAPMYGTTVRAAFLRGVKRTLTSNQTLEPTQVAGFNQFFDDFNGATSDLAAVGLDQLISPSARGGVSFMTRKIQHTLTVDPTLGTIRDVERRERNLRSYLYWTPNESASSSGRTSFS